LKYIHQSQKKEPTLNHFSCFADTRKVDFTNGQTRDDVSFYKKLARINKAAELGMGVDDYVKILQVAKSGKFNIIYNTITKKNGKK